MPNIHGLHSLNNDAGGGSDDDKNDDDNNDRYVGGVDSRGGGSGLAVMPNRDQSAAASNASDSIFNLAEAGTGAGAAGSGGGGGGGGEVRRTITMYRSGFTVDNGPHRRLDDPDNAEFLTSLARGMIPRELSQEARESGEDGEVMVGLVDRRGEDYDPERHGQQSAGGGGGGGFQSFSGEGQSLGGSGGASAAAASASAGGVISPSSQGTPATLDASRPSTSVAIRLLNGKRLVVKVNLDSPVSELGRHIGSQAGEDPYVLTSGYPPATITDLEKSVEEAGLKGAQVVLKKA
eukprot:CAMPEP_0183701898 /NCGR_PEP_ID=MMETSP0737-20130205/134_1 /TAXON_ID=385413 /ORGANISM="Thalassiosira miniscula, Strain CCMP1093" /LENGTH=291 /DNA_ID=CAMNT_0025928395 /DNA_START=45 /DNA_END=920 /DNA_ORIENTATION=+